MTQHKNGISPELIAEIAGAFTEIKDVFGSLTDDLVNKIPYEGSWTAAQLLRHVVKSTAGIAQALHTPGEPADRAADARVDELKTMFLNFATKLQSPEFIVPEEKVYEKAASLAELTTTFENFRKNAAAADPNELVTGLPLGDITKFELANFVLLHTQRHLHQLKKIVAALR